MNIQTSFFHVPLYNKGIIAKKKCMSADDTVPERSDPSESDIDACH